MDRSYEDADAREPAEKPSKNDMPIPPLCEAHDPAIKIVSKDGNADIAADGAVLRYGRLTRWGKEEHFETPLSNVTSCETELLSTCMLLGIHVDAPSFPGYITLVIDKEDEEKVRSLEELMPHTSKTSFEVKRRRESGRLSAEEEASWKSCCLGCLGVLVVLGILVYGLVSLGTQSREKESQKRSRPPTRKELVEKHFSVRDGSHKGLTRYIKRRMKDPGSYKHINTIYVDHKDFIAVSTEFSGKNSFGGRVVTWLGAKVDVNGNVMEITGGNFEP